MRKVAIVTTILVSVAGVLCGAMWWRLGVGPLAFDVATPWLAAALEERFGGRHQVELGGTQLERDEDGRTALRLRDVVVRDTEGAVVASAPKAEVGIATASLLTGSVRAERLSLIGAELAVRIEPSGNVNVFAGGLGTRPLASVAGPVTGTVRAPADTGAQPSAPATQPQAAAANAASNLLLAILDWVQSLDVVGLDGRDLMEIGLKNGTLIVEDQRKGKRLKFDSINLSMSRPSQGGAALAVSSTGSDGMWSLNATVTPRPDGVRAIEAVVRDISPKDILLGLRLDREDIQADIPLSAIIRTEIPADGVPRMLQGRILAGAGFVGYAHDRDARILIDEAQVDLQWDAATRSLHIPIEIHSGGNRTTLLAELQPPSNAGDAWSFAVSKGTVALASLSRPNEPELVLDHVNLRGSVDPAKQLIELEQADLWGPGAGLALSGAFDFSKSEPHLTVGLAGTRMSVETLKRLWPTFVATDVRNWVEAHVHSGSVEKLEIAANAPLSAYEPGGMPWPENGLSINIIAKDSSVIPLDGLLPVRDVDITTRVTGKLATVTFGRGVMDLSSGRKLALAGGRFEVTDINAKPRRSRTSFRVEGPLDAATELLSAEPLRDTGSIPFETSALRGNVTAQIAVGVLLGKPVSKTPVTYVADAEVSAFSAERFFHGARAEASSLRISANQDAVQIKGDMKIAGTPASVEYRRARGESEADIRMQATLDDAARARFGVDLANGLTGSVPVKLSGRMKLDERETRLAVEADLTQARVSDLVPGWVKAPGKPAKVSFLLVDRGQGSKLDDFALEGSGASLKGAIELDAQGEILNANFPSFAVSDGDKASARAERGSDGVLKIVVRGDLIDGRGLAKTAVAGQKPGNRPKRSSDIDLDVKVGAVTGHHGETMRSVELRASRRAGQIRAFSLSGKLGQHAQLAGDFRTRGQGRQVIHLETGDAGALFRFADIYPRLLGGSLSVAMDPPTADGAPQEGLLNIRDFAVRGEATLEQVASTSGDGNERGRTQAPDRNAGVWFSRLRAEFTRSPGRVAIRDGVVWGPAIGATVDGSLDYVRDEVRLRGTFIPAYALNNMFSRVPVLGMFLGGGANEGLLGVTYQVVGTSAAPVLQVNPVSVVMPGFLRKLFEFRGTEEQARRSP